jgi:hypothetical protein
MSGSYTSQSGLGATLTFTPSPNSFVVSQVRSQTALNLAAQLLALISSAFALCVNLLIVYHKWGDRRRATSKAPAEQELPSTAK